MCLLAFDMPAGRSKAKQYEVNTIKITEKYTSIYFISIHFCWQEIYEIANTFSFYFYILYLNNKQLNHNLNTKLFKWHVIDD